MPGLFSPGVFIGDVSSASHLGGEATMLNYRGALLHRDKLSV
jgi:hypothetical protein